MSATNKEQPKHERLEIPASTSLERRLLVNDEPQAKPNIGQIGPSPLLGTLQQFLPQMEKSNLELHSAQDQIRMEQVSDAEEGPYIELDLACGLFDLKDDAAVEAAERALIHSGVAIETFQGGSSDSDSSDSEDTSDDASSDEEMNDDEQPAKSKADIKKKKRGNAGIEELN